MGMAFGPAMMSSRWKRGRGKIGNCPAERFGLKEGDEIDEAGGAWTDRHRDEFGYRRLSALGVTQPRRPQSRNRGVIIEYHSASQVVSHSLR